MGQRYMSAGFTKIAIWCTSKHNFTKDVLRQLCNSRIWPSYEATCSTAEQIQTEHIFLLLHFVGNSRRNLQRRIESHTQVDHTVWAFSSGGKANLQEELKS